MRARALILLGGLAAAALAGCADSATVTAADKPSHAATFTRTVWVDAVTYWTSSSTATSGGYAKGWATPVGSGTGYQMGDVEANGNDGAYFVEQTGYTGQLDAFKYNSSCTHKWISGVKTVISTASTIYLADYPTATMITLQLTCPGTA